MLRDAESQGSDGCSTSAGPSSRGLVPGSSEGSVIRGYIYIYIHILGSEYGICWVYYMGYIGIMENKMETTKMGYIGSILGIY